MSTLSFRRASLAWLCCSIATQVFALEDPHAGYALRLGDASEWVHEISYSPGITSKLCLERASPSLFICIQSLAEPIAIDDVEPLAKGFAKGIAARFDTDVDLQTLRPITLGTLQGYTFPLELSSAELSEHRRRAQLFAGIDERGHPRLAIAFGATSTSVDRGLQRVLASLTRLAQ